MKGKWKYEFFEKTKKKKKKWRKNKTHGPRIEHNFCAEMQKRIETTKKCPPKIEQCMFFCVCVALETFACWILVTSSHKWIFKHLFQWRLYVCVFVASLCVLHCPDRLLVECHFAGSMHAFERTRWKHWKKVIIAQKLFWDKLFGLLWLLDVYHNGQVLTMRCKTVSFTNIPSTILFAVKVSVRHPHWKLCCNQILRNAVKKLCTSNKMAAHRLTETLFVPTVCDYSWLKSNNCRCSPNFGLHVPNYGRTRTSEHVIASIPQKKMTII